MPHPSDINELSLSDLYSAFAPYGFVQRLIDLARDEDLAQHGDITSAACFTDHERSEIISARIVSRSDAVVSGLVALQDIALAFDSKIRSETLCNDGDSISKGSALARIHGPRASVLSAERTLLNLLSRMCGIATATHQYIDHMQRGAPRSTARIFDTRKTTPGLRLLEKYAVRCGGGFCHRIGLHDAVLIKDNHLSGLSIDQLAHFVTNASAIARKRWSPSFVQVEVDNLEQLSALLELDRGIVDIILLDNMDIPELSRAVNMRNGSPSRPLLEASGGISLKTVAAVAATGVDRISVGAITHHAVSLDLGLDFE